MSPLVVDFYAFGIPFKQTLSNKQREQSLYRAIFEERGRSDINDRLSASPSESNVTRNNANSENHTY
jgi:hypothetical protein